MSENRQQDTGDDEGDGYHPGHDQSLDDEHDEPAKEAALSRAAIDGCHRFRPFLYPSAARTSSSSSTPLTAVT